MERGPYRRNKPWIRRAIAWRLHASRSGHRRRNRITRWGEGWSPVLLHFPFIISEYARGNGLDQFPMKTVVLQQLLFVAVGNKARLNQDGRHFGSTQHIERRLLNAQRRLNQSLGQMSIQKRPQRRSLVDIGRLDERTQHLIDPIG